MGFVAVHDQTSNDIAGPDQRLDDDLVAKSMVPLVERKRPAWRQRPAPRVPCASLIGQFGSSSTVETADWC